MTARLCMLLLPAPVLSCQELNPQFCIDHRGDPACRDPGETGGTGVDGVSCFNDSVCTSPTPVCDIARSTCVQCTAGEPGACRGATPTCGSDGTCRACAADADCESLTCLPDGSCAAPIEVLHAAPDGRPMASCTPADECSLLRAIGLVDGTKSTIHLDAGAYGIVQTLALSGSMRLVGRGAVIRALAGTATTLQIGQDAEIELDYLAVDGSAGAGDGIACTGGTLTAREVAIENTAAMGVDAASCSVTITHARIAGNRGVGVQALGGAFRMTRSTVIGNAGGGVVVESPLEFDVENNLIAQNSGPGAQGGFIVFAVDAAKPHVFAFNTVALNVSASPRPGVACYTASNAGVVLASNIVFGNTSSSTPSQVVTDNCRFVYSDIGPATFVGAGNLASLPQFVNPARGDFHLLAGSPARDAADPSATLAVDLDGTPRPLGAGRDMGAYENQ